MRTSQPDSRVRRCRGRLTGGGSRRAAAALAGIACAGALAAPTLAGGTPQSPEPIEPRADAAAFDENGMWIWYVSRASGGSPAKIAHRARSHGIGTVYIKAGDGDDPWSQFTPALVGALQRRGLHVCAWVFVYGRDPEGEAAVSADAASDGAECLVIDAESSYEGRYAAASTYVARLRAAVGDDYPLGLTGFPYVHYHPAYPYSVFLGPGGAEFNLPQVYWRAIGDSVDEAVATTYTYNRVYERPILPLGQLYGDPPRREVLRFRRLAIANGFDGVSWWSWQDATPRGWRALAKRRLRAPRRYVAPRAYPKLERGSKGDLVVWAQEHLVGGGYLAAAVTGDFGAQTDRATRAFQAAAGLAQTGVINAATWQALLASTEPAAVDWSARAHARSGHAATPASARLAPRRNELAGARAQTTE